MIIGAPADLTIVSATKVFQCGAICSQTISDDGFGPAIPAHLFLQEFLFCHAIAALCNEALGAVMCGRLRFGVQVLLAQRVTAWILLETAVHLIDKAGVTSGARRCSR